MAFKDWYRGLLRFLPKSMLKQFSIDEHSKNFPELNFFDKTTRKQLEQLIGTRINNIAHFEQAMTHRSFQQVLKPAGIEATSNERLEFLGDSVIGLIISDYLFNFFPSADEGQLTKMRSQLVNRNALANVAKQIGLKQFIRISNAAAREFDKSGDTIISDAFEALIAAIYFDSGIEKAVAFTYRTVIPLLEQNDAMADNNYKSQLLELAQGKHKQPPKYNVISENGPPHAKIFTVGVYSNDVLIGSGDGKNKKEAEQNAAKNAVENFYK
ncbi:MAG: ribonuclease III [Ignavibacteria bacterium]|jgi:ribonuclease-3|nr:ribonuclease III [Ignavibacteria bacterium]